MAQFLVIDNKKLLHREIACCTTKYELTQWNNSSDKDVIMKMWHSYSLKSLVVYFSSPSPQNFVTIISWHLIVIYSSFSSILHPHCHHHSSHHTHCCHFQLVNSTLSFVAFIANVFFCSHNHHFKFQKSNVGPQKYELKYYAEFACPQKHTYIPGYNIMFKYKKFITWKNQRRSDQYYY